MSTPTAETAPTVDTLVYTPEQLATHWNQGADGPWTAASIRQLCRDGNLPATKLGKKLWVVPAAALVEALGGKGRATEPANSTVTMRAPSRPHRVELRKGKG
jgi:hypothetical protein